MTDTVINSGFGGDGAEPLSAEYTQTVFQDIARALRAERGAFYPDKNYGSELRKIKEEPVLLYALCLARSAVYGMDGVYISKAQRADGGLEFTVIINDMKREVFVPIELNI